jgi:hypothetical protein
MALPFALRPRIRLRDEPEPSRSEWVTPIALPVAVYWAVMCLLTYGVSKVPSFLSRERAPTERIEFESFAPSASRPVAAVAEPSPPGIRAALDARPLGVPSRFDPSPSQPEAPRVAAESRRPAPSRAPSMRVQAFHDLQHAADDAYSLRTINSLGEYARDEALEPVDNARDDSAPAPSRAGHDRPVPAPSQPVSRTASVVPSCESVLATAKDEMDLTAARGVPDLSRDAYAAVLENGAYLSPCAIPERTELDICAAVQRGRAVGVTVVTRPEDARVSACVRGAVASITFPTNPRLDVTRTHFEAVRPR